MVFHFNVKKNHIYPLRLRDVTEKNYALYENKHVLFKAWVKNALIPNPIIMVDWASTLQF